MTGRPPSGVVAFVALCLLAWVAPAAEPQTQSIDFTSDTTWDVYDGPPGSPGATNLGKAVQFCGPPWPWGCTDIPPIGGVWIWAPGLTLDTFADLAQFYFTKTIMVPGTPTAGSLAIVADDFAEVFINGVSVGTHGSTTDVSQTGTHESKTFDIVALLKQGNNTITVRGQNGNASMVGWVCNPCTYARNPGAVRFVASITYSAGFSLRWPVDNPSIGQTYACRGLDCAQLDSTRYKKGINVHTGVDVRPVGADLYGDYTRPVVAAADGVVANIVYCETKEKEKQNNHGLGNTVILTHPNGLHTLYGHLYEIEPTLAIGQQVRQGDSVGIMGNSAYSTCGENQEFPVHVHFELKKNPTLGNLTDEADYWGYVPGHPDAFGYLDPRQYVIDLSEKKLVPVAVRNEPPDPLLVRGVPGLKYDLGVGTDVVERLAENQEYVATRRVPYEGYSWYFIDLPSANEPLKKKKELNGLNNGPNGGWIREDKVSLDPGAALVRVTEDGVFVRSGPSTKEEELAKIYTNQRFVTFGEPTLDPECKKDCCATAWHHIFLPGDGAEALSGATDGWVCGDYLELGP